MHLKRRLLQSNGSNLWRCVSMCAHTVQMRIWAWLRIYRTHEEYREKKIIRTSQSLLLLLMFGPSSHSHRRSFQQNSIIYGRMAREILSYCFLCLLISLKSRIRILQNTNTTTGKILEVVKWKMTTAKNIQNENCRVEWNRCAVRRTGEEVISKIKRYRTDK